MRHDGAFHAGRVLYQVPNGKLKVEFIEFPDETILVEEEYLRQKNEVSLAVPILAEFEFVLRTLLKKNSKITLQDLQFVYSKINNS